MPAQGRRSTSIRGGDDWAVFEWIGRGTFSLPAFSQFKDDRYFAGLNNIQASKTLELTESKGDSTAGGEAILRYDNGWPALSRKTEPRRRIQRICPLSPSVRYS